MGRELYEAFPSARAVFERVSDAVGRSLATVCFEMDEETLRETRNAQIALFTCGLAAFEALRLALPRVTWSGFAGHSVGEYAALVAAGILEIEDGARLVDRRGEVMADSGRDRPGTMAAVLGLEVEALEAICREASCGDEVVVVANDNCPGQLVISGDRAAVARASESASARGAKRVIPLNVSGAFHSPLMAEPARRLAEALRRATFRPGGNVYANVTARVQPDPAAWPALLEEQLVAPVRWTESIRAMRADGCRTFVEFGVGDVLTGLLRRIDRDARGLRVADRETLSATVAALEEELS